MPITGISEGESLYGLEDVAAKGMLNPYEQRTGLFDLEVKEVVDFAIASELGMSLEERTVEIKKREEELSNANVLKKPYLRLRFSLIDSYRRITK